MVDPARAWIWVTRGTWLRLMAAAWSNIGCTPTDFSMRACTSSASTWATCGSPQGAEVYQKFYEVSDGQRKAQSQGADARPEQWRSDLLCLGISSSRTGRSDRRHLSCDGFPELAGARQGSHVPRACAGIRTFARRLEPAPANSIRSITSHRWRRPASRSFTSTATKTPSCPAARTRRFSLISTGNLGVTQGWKSFPASATAVNRFTIPRAC